MTSLAEVYTHREIPSLTEKLGLRVRNFPRALRQKDSGGAKR